jgi:beta-glucosidase
MMEFPRGFLWGAATSAYQVEGNNRNADWWQWEKDTGKENSGQACRHYELYAQDFDLARDLHHNAHRLSIEWSRIEPEEGKFSQQELQHYLDVIRALRQRNIEPVVTLHHFTNPAWFSRSTGWEKPRSPSAFLRYCEFVVRALAEHVHYWITINEPTIYLSHAYIMGVWPPQARSIPMAKAVENNLIAAHIRSFRLIHSIYRESNLPAPAVGIAQHMQAFIPCTQAAKNRFAAYLRDRWYNFGIIDSITRHRAADFIGINYYSRQMVDLKKWGLSNFTRDICEKNHHPVRKNSLGWDIYPEGLYELLMKLKKYRLPIIVTENGICTENDDLRWQFIRAHLENIHRALKEGAAVTGYLYWSLMDNFEWDKGFTPRFGLLEIDYSTFARTIRNSAVRFGEVCKTGILE